MVAWRFAAALAAGLFVAGAPALAQQDSVKCSDGKLTETKCANPRLSKSLRQSTVIRTQPKLSYTGPLANEDVETGSDRGLYYENNNPVQQVTGTFIRIPPSVNPASLNLTRPYTVVPGGIRIH